MAATGGEYGCITPQKNKKKKENDQNKKQSTSNRNYFDLNLVYFNCRGLASGERIYEFEQEINNIKWDVIGLSEIRRKGERLYQTGEGHLIYQVGSGSGHRGVGFYIHRKVKRKIIEIKGVNERVCWVKIEIDKNTRLLVVQIHAPTMDATETESEEFYRTISEIIREEKETFIAIIGDFNAKVGKEEHCCHNIGKWGLGERNRNGETLVNFAVENNLLIANTFFKKKQKVKWTWRSPNLITRNEIDHILINNRTIVQDVSVLVGFKFPSDHRMCRAKLKIPRRYKYIPHNQKKSEMKVIIPKNKLYAARNKMKVVMNNILENNEKHCVQAMYNQIEEGIKQIEAEFGEKRGRVITDDKLTEETKNLIVKRNSLANKPNLGRKERVELMVLKHITKKKIRKDIREYDMDRMIDLIEENGAIKKARKVIYAGKLLVNQMLNKEGKEIINRKGIVKRATEFYEELYKSTNKNNKTTWENQLVDMEQIPPIMEDEVEAILGKSKSSKVAGPDLIENEILKNFKKELKKVLTKLFERIINEEIIPIQWNVAEIILLHKKGNRNQIDNYRPISLTSNLCKIFAKIIKERVHDQLDWEQAGTQAGFRKDRSTIDQIFIINQIIEKTHEYNLPVYMMFVDFRKAFDTVDHTFLWEALRNQGINWKYIKVIKIMYEQAEAYVKMDQKGDNFKVERGVRQGDPLSPNLFNAILEEIFRKLEWEGRGLRINGEYLNNLRFADDVVLIGRSREEIESFGTELAEKSRLAGLEVNWNKTRILTKEARERVRIEGVEVGWEEEFRYLGQIVSFMNRREKELKARIMKGWKKYWSLKDIFKGEGSQSIKSRIWGSCVQPVLSYGAQTWSLTRKDLQKLQNTQKAMERSMLGIRKSDRIQNPVIKEKTKLKNIGYAIKKLKWKYGGHLARLKTDRWEKKIEEWVPYEGKRERGRPVIRWRDEFYKQIGLTWKRETTDRQTWKRKGEAYAQLWV